MSAGLLIDNIFHDLGLADVLDALFSTIGANLERGEWGSRFPLILRDLYYDQLDSLNASAALSEIRTIRRELSRKGPEFAVWDIRNIQQRIPDRPQIWKQAPNLAELFKTSTGRNMLDSLEELIEILMHKGGVAKIYNIK
jgi:2,3-bisphosphoglycerate-dependent phosphoglycerate mutase